MNDFAKILSIIWIIATFLLLTRTVASHDDGAEYICSGVIAWIVIGWIPVVLARVLWQIL